MENVQRGATQVASGEGKTLWVLGDLYEFKATGEDTGGTFALWETTTPPGNPISRASRKGAREKREPLAHVHDFVLQAREGLLRAPECISFVGQAVELRQGSELREGEAPLLLRQPELLLQLA